MKLGFFCKMHSILCRLQKCNKKFNEMFRVLKIVAFEHVSGISPNYDENRWERQSPCCEKVLKFHISKKEMFSNSICLGLMEN